ncbi:tetratricopeptide repeat protein, partial [Bacteroides acidifaciens]
MRALTIFFLSLFSLPLMLNAQSVDEMLQKVSAAIEAGQHGQAVSYFRQTISLNIDRTEMYYWTSVDKNSEISVNLANELAIAYRKRWNYDKAYLFYKELLQKAPNNVGYLESCAEMQVCRGQEKDALRLYEKILQLDADNLAANIFLGNYYYLMAEREKKQLETDYKKIS